MLVAEGSGGKEAPKLRPKDVIAGVIKKQGNTKVDGGDRITLLRDADGDGVAEARSVLLTGLTSPFGMALVDRDGRFLQMNNAFQRAARVKPDTAPVYPGDLVVRLAGRVVRGALARQRPVPRAYSSRMR